MKNCPNCGEKVKDDDKFCPKCGNSTGDAEVPKLVRLCENCGADVPAGSKFCTKCGAVVKEVKCPKCGIVITDNPYCPNCGLDLSKKSNLDVAIDNLSESTAEIVSGVHNFLRDRKKDLDDFAETRRR